MTEPTVRKLLADAADFERLADEAAEADVPEWRERPVMRERFVKGARELAADLRKRAGVETR